MSTCSWRPQKRISPPGCNSSTAATRATSIAALALRAGRGRSGAGVRRLREPGSVDAPGPPGGPRRAPSPPSSRPPVAGSDRRDGRAPLRTGAAALAGGAAQRRSGPGGGGVAGATAVRLFGHGRGRRAGLSWSQQRPLCDATDQDPGPRAGRTAGSHRGRTLLLTTDALTPNARKLLADAPTPDFPEVFQAFAC